MSPIYKFKKGGCQNGYSQSRISSIKFLIKQFKIKKNEKNYFAHVHCYNDGSVDDCSFTFFLSKGKPVSNSRQDL